MEKVFYQEEKQQQHFLQCCVGGIIVGSMGSAQQTEHIVNKPDCSWSSYGL